MTQQDKEIISISAHDSYSCTKSKDVESMDCCKTCTSRQPNAGCKYLKIETVYVKD